MCDGGGAPLNVCYKGAVARMTRPQVSGTGEGKQMKPQLNCSDRRGRPPGAPLRPEELCLPGSQDPMISAWRRVQRNRTPPEAGGRF